VQLLKIATVAAHITTATATPMKRGVESLTIEKPSFFEILPLKAGRNIPGVSQ